MVHIKDPTTKALKYNEFINNKLYYHLKPNEMPALRFYDQSKI